MADVFTKEKRSEVMSRVRGKGNKKTEIALLNLFRLHGITGWRRHYKIEGKPDFAFPKERFAVFVDGCFWHGCPKHGTQPRQNADFWRRKLMTNKRRDAKVKAALLSKGWQVMRIWEHDLKPSKALGLIRRITRVIKKHRTFEQQCRHHLSPIKR